MNLKNAKVIANTLGIDLLSLPIRQRPFRIQWQNEQAMFAFYHTFLTQKEVDTYRFLAAYAAKGTVYTRKNATSMLSSSFPHVTYDPQTHQEVVSFFEQYAPPDDFKQFRLLDVTGSLLENDDYPLAFKYVLKKTMEKVANTLITRINDEINTSLKKEFFKRLERKEKIIDKHVYAI